MERKLASIQLVSDLQPIEGADLIEVATINSWKLVTKKGEFQKGDKAVYFEIDSFLPIKPEYEFLRKSSFKKMGEQEGFRLRTIKLRGQVSQGLLLPLSILPSGSYEVGQCVTELLEVCKYEPPIPAQLAGKMRGYFPSFIPKTDEERIQNLTEAYPIYKKSKLYATEKLDGSSATFYYNDGYFGVASRNIDLHETPDNTFWSVARLLDIENKIKSIGNYALQGEMIGEGIQGNPYKIKGQTVRFFNCFNIDTQSYCSITELVSICEHLGLLTVPIISMDFKLPETIDELLAYADGYSSLNDATIREGIVIRSYDKCISFKAISNTFLLKEK